MKKILRKNKGTQMTNTAIGDREKNMYLFVKSWIIIFFSVLIRCFATKKVEDSPLDW